jgi:hypothetical protein
MMQQTLVGSVGQKLLVHVVRAQGLEHMNHFTGDHPYVQAEIKHLNHHTKVTRAQTRPITEGDTMNPYWDERLELEPWTPGDNLELTVYDKGLLGSKTEGKVMLPSQNFYPNGFNGMLPISGLQHASLQVAVQVLGAPASTSYAIPAATSYSTAQPATYSAAQPTMYAQPASSVAYSQPATMATQSAAPTYSSASPQAYSSPVTYSAPMAQSMAYSAPTTYAQQAPTYAAPQATSTFAAAQPAYSPQSSVSVVQAPMTQSYSTSQAPMQQPYMMQGGQMYGGGAYGTGAYKLAVSIIQAQGLKHMNHFTGDHPYVVCEVKHAAHRERRTKVETKPVTVGDSSNPYWNETLELEPWHPGEPLEFSVYDKGLIGSKTEGKATLPGELFSQPNGFSGNLPIAGLSHALLYVTVRVLGPSVITTEANSGMFAPKVEEQTVMTPEGPMVQETLVSKKRSKKLKVGSKKKSGCC